MVEKQSSGKIIGLVSVMAIELWDLYVIANEHVTISKVWNDRQLMISFGRAMNKNLMNTWYKLVSVIESLQVNMEKDSPIWKLESK
jgi:hypothetical protein